MEAVFAFFFLAAIVAIASAVVLYCVDGVRNFGKVKIKKRTVIGEGGGELVGLIAGTAGKLSAFNVFLLFGTVGSVWPAIIVWRGVLNSINAAGLAMSTANVDMTQFNNIEKMWTYGFPVVCFFAIGVGYIVVKCLIGIAAVLCAEYLEALADD